MNTQILPDLIADAFAALPVRAGGKYVLCVPFSIDEDVVRLLLTRPDISALIVGRTDETPDPVHYSKMVVAFSTVDKPDAAIWSGAESLLFIGFGSNIPYGMLTSALRAGVKTVASLIKSEWERKSTWTLLAERHFRAGVIYAPYRMLVHRLDQYGARFSPARTLAQTLNGGTAIGDVVRSLPARSSNPNAKGIAFYTGSLGAGGAERQMVNTILALVKRGIGPIRVACAGDAHGFYRPVLDAAGIPVETVRGDAGGPSSYLSTLSVDKLRKASGLPREIVMDTVALSDWLEQSPPSILHCWQDHCNVVGGLAGLLSGVPKIILSTRSVAPYNFGFFQLNQRPAYRAFASRPEVTILNNSSKGADDYAHWLGIDRKLIEVIRNGVDLTKLVKPEPQIAQAFRRSLGIPDGAPVLGTIFTIYKFKRPLLWVDAAAAVAKVRPDAHFLMVGDGPMRQETEARIAQYGLTDRFHLPGRMEDVALAFSAMQSFLLTSIHEGLPNVLLEAQMIGVPAITVDVGGAAEAIDDGETGVVVRGAAPEQLAEAALAMFDDRQQAKSAHAGPLFVQERFGMDRMIEETLSSYGLLSASVSYGMSR